MKKPIETSKQRKAKQKFVYFIDSCWSGFGPGVECINEEDIIVAPTKGLTPGIDKNGRSTFKPMSGIPLLQFKGKEPKYHDDFDILGGIWILSPPVREFFERIDCDAFEFRECKTIYPDSTAAPPRSLAVMTRKIDALDVEKSKSVPNIYDPTGFKVVLPGNDKDYFRASAVGDYDFFVDVRRSNPTLVSQRVKDEFKKQGWRGAAFLKAYLI